jgi:hypothetical protein
VKYVVEHLLSLRLGSLVIEPKPSDVLAVPQLQRKAPLDNSSDRLIPLLTSPWGSALAR